MSHKRASLAINDPAVDMGDVEKPTPWSSRRNVIIHNDGLDSLFGVIR